MVFSSFCGRQLLKVRRLAPGPQNWARIRIVELSPKEAEGNTHRAALAFDTATMPRTPGAGFLTPWERETARLVAEGSTIQVCYDYPTKSTITMSSDLRSRIEAMEGHAL